MATNKSNRFSWSRFLLFIIGTVLFLPWPVSIFLPLYAGEEVDPPKHLETSWPEKSHKEFWILGPTRRFGLGLRSDGEVVFWYGSFAGGRIFNQQLGLIGVLGMTLLFYCGVKPWIIRSYRQRNQLCVACAYPRIGLEDRPCPECGTPTDSC